METDDETFRAGLHMEKKNKWNMAIPPFETDGHQGSKSPMDSEKDAIVNRR